MTNEKPNPGSDRAIEQGCICAVSDNAHGDERLGRARGFYIEKDCPLHDEPEQIGDLTKDTEDYGEKMTNNKPREIINSAVGKYIELYADSKYKLGDPAMYPKVTELFDEKIKEIEEYAQEYCSEMKEKMFWELRDHEDGGKDVACLADEILRKLNKEKGGKL